jgi:hypothetical protein
MLCPRYLGDGSEVGSQQEGMVDGTIPIKWFAQLANIGDDYAYNVCSHRMCKLTWNRVRPCLVRQTRMLFSSKQQRRAEQLRTK